MRMSTFQLNSMMMGGMQTANSNYNTTVMQMQQQTKILTPSDDPIGSVQIMLLQHQQTATDQYSKNIKNLMNEYTQQEALMRNGNDILLRGKELTLGLGNGAMTQDDRQAMANELESIRDELLSVANSQNPDGGYQFAGNKLKNKPYSAPDYAYQGDNARRTSSTAEGVTLPVNMTADTIFGSGNDTVFKAIDDLTAALCDPATPQSELEKQMKNVNSRMTATSTQLNSAWGSLGSQMQSLERMEGAHEDNTLMNKKMIADIQDLDIPEAVSRLKGYELALTATQLSYSKINDMSLFNYIR
ncbi:MAG: flagellar hook-associated protein FlgL [Plesiomonas sp.]|uniref:flagellar hook-associated protein FlgL n=2 Tax=Plesiomonas sp. TaxID=2486279 RepID=UPI003EE54CC7